MKNSSFRPFELALMAALCVTLCAALPVQKTGRGISDKVVRLHVIAVSDSEEEQAIKLRVRDGVLAYLSPLLAEASTREEAERVITGSLDGIAEAAAARSEGRGVTVELGRESYPTRYYDGFALPAGAYSSLRVTLGKGEGRNWWCVVFPELCTGAVSRDSLAAAGFSDGETAILAEGDEWELRFRLVELWGELFGR